MKFQTNFNFEDHKDKTYGYVAPLREVPERAKDGSKQWEFKCICGNTFITTPYRVISGHKKSCGCMRYKNIVHKEHNRENLSKVNFDDYIGQKNNRLTVIGYNRPKDGGRAKLVCLCECGNTTEVLPYQFLNGKVLSCGCARFGHSECHKGNTSRRTHNLSRDPFYKKWGEMVKRCYREDYHNYPRYGGVGITVCDEWRNGPENFVKWCHETFPQEGGPYSIDRIDDLKGYSPDNCRWATPLQQAHNTRSNRNITINGETKCLTEWCRQYGIRVNSVYNRSSAKSIPVEASLIHFIERAKMQSAEGVSQKSIHEEEN